MFERLSVSFVQRAPSFCESPCAVKQLFTGESKVIYYIHIHFLMVSLSLSPPISQNVIITLSTEESGLSPGSMETTFNLTSQQTEDADLSNNAVSVTTSIERRADLAISM